MTDYGGFAFIDKEKLTKQLRQITCNKQDCIWENCDCQHHCPFSPSEEKIEDILRRCTITDDDDINGVWFNSVTGERYPADEVLGVLMDRLRKSNMLPVIEEVEWRLKMFKWIKKIKENNKKTMKISCEKCHHCNYYSYNFVAGGLSKIEYCRKYHKEGVFDCPDYEHFCLSDWDMCIYDCRYGRYEK